MVNEHRAKAEKRKADDAARRAALEVRRQAQVEAEVMAARDELGNHAFVFDGSQVFSDRDFCKGLYAQGLGYHGWWDAAKLDRLNDMLGGGFGFQGQFSMRIVNAQKLKVAVSARLLAIMREHRNCAAWEEAQ